MQTQLLQRLPFLLELFINGIFILLYSLMATKKVPVEWNLGFLEEILRIGAYLVPVILTIHAAANYFSCKKIDEYIRKYIFSILIILPLFITWGDVEFSFWLASAHLFSSIMALYDLDTLVPTKKIQKQNWIKRVKFSPAQLVLVSFTGMILLGSFLLVLPVSPAEGKSLSVIDAIFMATSATCVTGLSTLSLGNDFSIFGQILILILIQVGGLGIMTLTSSMTILLGKSMGMKDRVMMQDLLDISSLEELFAMIVDIIKYTFIIEVWGGIILTIAFTFEGFELGTALYYGFFHSVSAFCNAGFSLFDNSLESYGTNPLIHGTIAVLVTLGGLGFIVLRELKDVVTFKKTLSRLSMHSKIVLMTSLVLTVTGAMFIFFSEFLDSFDGYSLWDKTQLALFQSITLRTAGFNTVPMGQLNSFTLYGMTLFMFIGASPGSTGGGIKTTTFAVLIQSIISTLKGQKDVVMLDRTISGPIVVRAIALTFISIIITSASILVLMKFESDQSFLAIFFEVISASGTVGLSLGLTPYLSVLGKVAVSILMLIGRIGPLTLLLAIGERAKQKGNYEYPDGRMMIG